MSFAHCQFGWISRRVSPLIMPQFIKTSVRLRSFILTCFIIAIDNADSVPLSDKRVRWIALGERIEETIGRTGVEIATWNFTYPVTTMVEIGYGAREDMRINWIVATATKMNGYVSLEDGGLGERYAKIKYTTENGAPDEFYLFIESYKVEPLILSDNSARTGNVAVVYNGIRNWTAQIFGRDF